MIVVAALAQHAAQLLADRDQTHRLPRRRALLEDGEMRPIDTVNAVGLPRSDPQMLARTGQRLWTRCGRRQSQDFFYERPLLHEAPLRLYAALPRRYVMPPRIIV